MSIGTTVIELREFKEKNNMDKMGNILSFNWKGKWYFSKIFHKQLCFDTFYAIKLSEVELT